MTPQTRLITKFWEQRSDKFVVVATNAVFEEAFLAKELILNTMFAFEGTLDRQSDRDKKIFFEESVTKTNTLIPIFSLSFVSNAPRLTTTKLAFLINAVSKSVLCFQNRKTVEKEKGK